MTTATMPTSAGTYMHRAPGWENAGWTAGPNAMIRDIAVEWDAKAAYMWIASHQELIFQLDAEKLAAAGPRGRDHAYEMLRTLEFHGWLTRHRYRATTGKGTVHIWTLHPSAVPLAERTWKPSATEKRKGYVTPSGEKVAGTAAPETLTVQDFQKLAGQPGTPDRPGSPDLEAPGIPDRPGTDRSGIRYMDEKTTGENQGGDSYSTVTSEPSPSEERPPSKILTRDINRPETWLCDHHLTNPIPVGAKKPSCPPCGDVAREAKAWLSRKAEQARAAAEACTWCDEYEMVIDPAIGAPFRPAQRCDHTSTSPEAVAASLPAAAPVLGHEPGALAARACDAVGWRPKPVPPRPPRGVHRRGASVPASKDGQEAAPLASGLVDDAPAASKEAKNVGV